MKLSRADAARIINSFGALPDVVSANQIESFSLDHPEPTNTLATVQINGQIFHLLFDDDVDGDEATIRSFVSTRHPKNSLKIAPNPHDPGLTGLPFKGKDVYLLREQRPTARLDSLLAEHQPQLSRSVIQKHIKAGHVQVDSQIITKPGAEVATGSVLELNQPDLPDHADHELPIIYIDDDVIVVDKPAGVLTHAKGGLNDEFTVATFFARYTTDGVDTNRPGIVHRLDRATSGIIIGARTTEARLHLQKQFAQRKVKKTYHAVVAPRPVQNEALIDVPIGRNPRQPSTFMADASGKNATTHYQVLEANNRYALLELKPATGRTHQLRIHLNYIKSPIVGDPVYGNQPAKRLFLHAHKLELTLPGSIRTTFTSPVPDSFNLDNFS